MIELKGSQLYIIDMRRCMYSVIKYMRMINMINKSDSTLSPKSYHSFEIVWRKQSLKISLLIKGVGWFSQFFHSTPTFTLNDYQQNLFYFLFSEANSNYLNTKLLIISRIGYPHFNLCFCVYLIMIIQKRTANNN